MQTIESYSWKAGGRKASGQRRTKRKGRNSGIVSSLNCPYEHNLQFATVKRVWQNQISPAYSDIFILCHHNKVLGFIYTLLITTILFVVVSAADLCVFCITAVHSVFLLSLTSTICMLTVFVHFVCVRVCVCICLATQTFPIINSRTSIEFMVGGLLPFSLCTRTECVILAIKNGNNLCICSVYTTHVSQSISARNLISAFKCRAPTKSHTHTERHRHTAGNDQK